MTQKLILAIDQGTSSTKTVLFNERGQILAKATAVLKSYFPQAGFVEQQAAEIYRCTLNSIQKCLNHFQQTANADLRQIKACGISNQRETFLLWDKTGQPLTNAVVWQCKRSIKICNRLRAQGLQATVYQKTGLIIDPYFSASKLIWLFENEKSVRQAIQNGDAYFGTVDSWLLFKLTNGTRYFTDYTNACRTLLFNLHDLQWDRELLRQFEFDRLNLPAVVPSAFHFGETTFEGLLAEPIPITAMIGDSHAAAFGEGCFATGTAKATLGTGSSILLNTGDKKIVSQNGMVTTICWSTQDRVDFALEGVIVTAGATIKWLRDQLGLFAESRDTELMATAVSDNNGVYVIPAFSGLGAPFWKMDLKGAIVGLTFGADKNHLVRAALESIPFQIKAVITAMENDSGILLKELNVDGGITTNRFVMQLLADLLETSVVNIGIAEVSALGACFLAGLEVGIFRDLKAIQELLTPQFEFQPGPATEKVQADYKTWCKYIQTLIN